MGAQKKYLALAILGICCCHALALPYTSSSPVTSLDSNNFKSKIKSAGFALVEFYAPWCGHCKSLQPEYEKVAKALKGIATVAAVDVDQEKQLGGEFNIKGFPTIKFVYMDGDKVKTADYNGQRTAKDLVSFAMDKAKNLALKRIGEKASNGGSGGQKAKSNGGGGSGAGGADAFYSGTDVVVLSEDNFDEEVARSADLVLVEFFAPWCGHCKALKPAWIEAASELKGKVKVAAIDCTASQGVCGRYGVQGYPTIKFFGANKAKPEDYQQGRDSSSIVAFATQRWAKLAPPPEVRELVSQAVLERECTGGEGGAGAKQLCFIAFLPNILDSKAAGRNDYISVLRKVADQYKDRPFSYLWVEGGAQAALEANFGVGGFGYPALIAFKPKDGRYALAKGAFEVHHVQEFIESLRMGRESVMGLQGALATASTITPWDGKDAQVQAEDEFSLDDIMGDKSEL